MLACVHPHSLIQKCLPTLKSPVVHLSILPPYQPLASSDPFIVSIVLPFPEGWDRTEPSLCRLTSFFQQDAFKIPPGYDFTADLFLTLTNIPLFGCLLIHSRPEGHLDCFQVLTLMNEVSMNIRVQAFVWK